MSYSSSPTVTPLPRQRTHAVNRVQWTSRQAQRLLRRLTWINLAGVLAVWAFLNGLSDSWWLSSSAGYLPRLPWAVPAMLLAVWSLIAQRKLFAVNLAAAALVCGPVMGFNVPWQAAPASIPGESLKVVTCNIHGFGPDFAQVLQEVSRCNPDIVVFQEALTPHPLLDRYFADWHTVHRGEYWVGSRFPLKELARCEVAAYNRTSALMFEVDAPAGKVRICDVHLMTPRHGLNHLRSVESLMTDAGEIVGDHLWLRDVEAQATRQFIDDWSKDRPVLALGDFNAVPSSGLFRRHWGDLRNAFGEVGWGYGYTFPDSQHRFWFDGLPWMRIDHILANERWLIHSCRTGTENGSDHRMVFAEVTPLP